MIVDERFHLPVEAYGQVQEKLNYSFGFNGFGEATYYRTYSRNDQGRQEHWIDTCTRVVNGVFSIRKDWYKKMGLRWDDRIWTPIATRMLEYMYQMKFLPPGRGLWAMGSDHVYEVGSMALNNCAFTMVNLEPERWIKDLGWSMDALLCGCGVGYRIPKSDGFLKTQLRSRQPSTRVCIIGDSREGWIASVELLLQSFVEGQEIHFDYSRVRPFGSIIKRFGGTASGPAPLMILHKRIEKYIENFLVGRCGQTRLLADIINAIGQCVVSGNVRRGAQIILGDLHDEEFINLKRKSLYETSESSPVIGELSLIYADTFEISKTDYPNGYHDSLDRLASLNAIPAENFLHERLLVGGLSNNSVALSNSDDFLGLPIIAGGIRADGEPGFLNLINVQKFGRFGHEMPDAAVGCNPCGEIPLEDKELCNLVELFPTRCSSIDEFMQATELATLYSQTVSLLMTHRTETNEVINRNRRIGVSISGCADLLDEIGAARTIRLLRDGYKLVTTTAKRLATEAGVPAPVRHTTIKPSGTISQLAGVSSGMHFPTFKYAIRRIRVSKGGQMDEILAKASIPHEVDVTDPSAEIYEFPIDQGKTRKATDVSVWEQLMFKAMLEREWADNMVSCTAYFNPRKEAKVLEHAIAQVAPIIKSMSILPHTEKGAYKQMPYEGISKKEYTRRLAQIKPIDWDGYKGFAENSSSVLYCESDVCEIVA